MGSLGYLWNSSCHSRNKNQELESVDITSEFFLSNALDMVYMIETTKIFNDLGGNQGGIVKKFLVEDEEPVMKNQELIEIEIG